MRGSPGAGQSMAALQHRPSSAQPLQSLSSLSQLSGDGPIEPMHGPHEPNSPPAQVALPSVQPPTPRRPGGPMKHFSTAPGRQAQPSSTVPLQLSSTPLPLPSAPQSSAALQPAFEGIGLGHCVAICGGTHIELTAKSAL